jgi:N utilization substance protein B
METGKNRGSRKARLRAARLAAVQTVYQFRYKKSDAVTAANDYLEHYAGMDIEGETILEPDTALYSSIVQGVHHKYGELEDLISQALYNKACENVSTGKKPVEHLLNAILLCGSYELLMHHDIDPPVIISDYVTVTRAFCEDRESGLVNAVLDNISSKIRG